MFDTVSSQTQKEDKSRRLRPSLILYDDIISNSMRRSHAASNWQSLRASTRRLRGSFDVDVLHRETSNINKYKSGIRLGSSSQLHKLACA